MGFDVIQNGGISPDTGNDQTTSDPSHRILPDHTLTYIDYIFSNQMTLPAEQVDETKREKSLRLFHTSYVIIPSTLSCLNQYR